VIDTSLKNFGIQAEDTRRTVAAAEGAVYELLDSTGSTLFDLETVIEQIASKLNGVLAALVNPAEGVELLRCRS
jgi:hypothetical protein